MDSSTIAFVATLAVAFIFLRWFISSDEDDEAALTGQQSSSSSSSTAATGSQAQDQPQAQRESAPEVRYRRPVSNDMIEVVQQLAPNLTVGQIKLDLQRTGSVQETVDRFLSEGSLPFPEGESPNTATTTGANAEDSRNRVDNIKPENLLKKYGINNNSKSTEPLAAATGSSSGDKGWSDSAEDRASSLQQKKVDMILKARRRLESQLKNEQDLSKLEE